MHIKNVEDIRTGCAPIFENTKARRVIVFGSWARGTQGRRSDIDMLIVGPTDKGFFDRHKDFNGLYETLKGYSIDLLVYTPEELEQIRHRRFIQKALSEGRVIYEC